MRGGPEVETTGILLRGVDYGEADRVCTFLTADFGKRAAFARRVRGSKKRFRGGLGAFSLLQLSWRERGGDQLVTLGGSDVIESWHAIGHDLERMAVGSMMLELLDGVLQDEQGAGAVFHTATRFFRWLHTDQGGPARVEAGGHRLQLLLLSDAGVLPPLDASVRTGEAWGDGGAAVWLPAVGIVRPEERLPGEHGVDLPVEALRYLEHVAAGKFPTTDAAVSRAAIRRALYQVWTHVFGRDLKSWSFYRDIYAPGER